MIALYPLAASNFYYLIIIIIFKTKTLISINNTLKILAYILIFNSLQKDNK